MTLHGIGAGPLCCYGVPPMMSGVVPEAAVTSPMRIVAGDYCANIFRIWPMPCTIWSAASIPS